MGSPTLPIQAAVYDLLTGDAPLGSMIAGVYEEVPETSRLPYVVVGEAYETPDNSHDRKGRRTVITLHAWSDQKGFSEAVGIADRVVDLLDHTVLDVGGWHHVATRYDFMQTLRDPDPTRRHVPVRFSVTTEEDVEESS